MATTATSSTPPAPITATPVAVMLDASCPRSCLNTVLCLRLYPRHQGLRHRLGAWSRSFPNTDTALLLLLLGVNFITATTPTNATTNSPAEWVWESSVCVVFLLENVFRWYIQWDGSARARAPLLKDTAVVGGLLCVLLLSTTTVVTTVVEASTMVAVAKVVRRFFVVVVFLCFLVCFALFIDLLTDKVQPLSRFVRRARFACWTSALAPAVSSRPFNNNGALC